MRLRTLFSAFILTISLAGCGGEGGDSALGTASTGLPPVVADGNGPGIVKVGPITGFGSVFVAGERFETDSDDTSVRKDDHDSAEDELKIGMIVRIRSSSKNAAGEWIADDIEFDEDVKGPVDSVASDSFVVMGQTVNVLPDTFFDDELTLEDLMEGDLVEVSGYRNEFDELDATYVELKAPGSVDEYEVLGQIRDLDTAAEQFRIGGLTVNYALATLDDLDSGLANGLLVEVEDENLSYIAGDLVLDATEVEGEDRAEFKDEDDDDSDEDGDDSDDHEFERVGIVTEILSETSFMLGTLEVQFNASTEFSGGTDADIVVGVRLEAEGELTDSGSLLAEEIEFEKSEARVSGLVNSVDADNDRLTVLGVLIQAHEQTEIEDERDDQMPFVLSDLMAGDFVEVEGAQVTDGVLAEEIEREDASDDSELRGLVEAADSTAGTVTLIGQLVTTDEQTEYECDEVDCGGAEEFFARIHAGQSVVEAKWDGPQSDTGLPADQLELED